MAWAKLRPIEPATDWMPSRRRDADQTAGHLAEFLFGDFPQNERELAWNTIELIGRIYPKRNFTP